MGGLVDHERIWLEPAPGDCNGRTWCQDKVWPEKEGDPEPTEYVRADIVAKQAAEILQLKQSNNRRKLEVYKANRRAEAALAELERR